MVRFVKHKSSLYLNLADFVLGMALVVLTCVNLSVLGVHWVQGSGCIPEHLTQVAHKIGAVLLFALLMISQARRPWC